MTTHKLKTKQPYFDLVRSGKKTFEVRQYTAQRGANCPRIFPHAFLGEVSICDCRPARNFQAGDTLKLINKEKPEEFVDVPVLYILKDTDFPEGIKPGFCVMALGEVTIGLELTYKPAKIQAVMAYFCGNCHQPCTADGYCQNNYCVDGTTFYGVKQ